MNGASQNIAEAEPPKTKDAFVASIMAIKAVTLSVMDAGSSQMAHPPDSQKESQQQAVQMRSLLELGGFDVPTTRLGILKGRFDAHAQRIRVDACFARRQVGNDQPRLLILLLPTGTHIGLDALLLPDTRTPIPLLTFLLDKALEGTPGTPLFVLAHLSAAGMLLTDAQHVMPVALLTEPNQRGSGQSSISQ